MLGNRAVTASVAARRRFWTNVTIAATIIVTIFILLSISMLRAIPSTPSSNDDANDDTNSNDNNNDGQSKISSLATMDAPDVIRGDATMAMITPELSLLFPGVQPRDLTTSITASNARHPRYRIAMIITWIGPQLPIWFTYFVQSAAASAYLFDILVFHEQCTLPPSQFIPHNVHFIALGRDGMGRLFGTKLADQLGIERRILVPMFQQLLASKAYFVTEYKPCTGTIFADYLTNYTHWTYGDPDVVLGDMASFVDLAELNYYDIVTWTFGDNWRLYLRGQFTLHRNDYRINTLWRACSFLSDGLVKQLRYKLGHQQCVSGGRKACFNSAEGCYSWVVVRAPNVKIKFATKFFMSNKPRTSALVIDDRVYHCKSTDCALVAPHLPTDTDSWSLIPRVHTSSLKGQHQLGQLYSFEIDNDGKHKCSAWVDIKYQVCAQEQEHKGMAKYNLYVINGTWYAQQFSRSNVQQQEWAFFHFQNLKDYFERQRSSAIDGTSSQWQDTHVLLRRYIIGLKGVKPVPSSLWTVPRVIIPESLANLQRSSSSPSTAEADDMDEDEFQ